MVAGMEHDQVGLKVGEKAILMVLRLEYSLVGESVVMMVYDLDEKLVDDWDDELAVQTDGMMVVMMAALRGVSSVVEKDSFQVDQLG